MDQDALAAGARRAAEDLGPRAGQEVVWRRAGEAARIAVVAVVPVLAVADGQRRAAGAHFGEHRAVEQGVDLAGSLGQAVLAEGADQRIGDLVVVPDRAAAGDPPDQGHGRGQRGADARAVLEVAERDGGRLPAVQAQRRFGRDIEQGLVERHLLGAVGGENS